MPYNRRFFIIFIGIIGVYVPVKAHDVLKLNRMLNVTASRRGNKQQEKNRPLKNMLIDVEMSKYNEQKENLEETMADLFVQLGEKYEEDNIQHLKKLIEEYSENIASIKRSIEAIFPEAKKPEKYSQLIEDENKGKAEYEQEMERLIAENKEKNEQEPKEESIKKELEESIEEEGVGLTTEEEEEPISTNAQIKKHVLKMEPLKHSDEEFYDMEKEPNEVEEELEEIKKPGDKIQKFGGEDFGGEDVAFPEEPKK